MSSGTVLCKRIGKGLFPANARAADALQRIPEHATVAVRIDRRRSAAQNCLYWSVLEQVVAATDRWRTAEELHVALKVATGHVDVVRLIDGRRVLVPESTAFDAMSQDEAQAFYDAAFRVIAEDLGLPLEDLLAHTGGEALAE